MKFSCCETCERVKSTAYVTDVVATERRDIRCFSSCVTVDKQADFMIFASAPEPDAAVSSLARRPKLFNALDNI